MGHGDDVFRPSTGRMTMVKSLRGISEPIAFIVNGSYFIPKKLDSLTEHGREISSHLQYRFLMVAFFTVEANHPSNVH